MYHVTYFKKTKYNNVRTSYDGYNYASKLEANQAAELDIQKRAGLIKDWERQYKVEVYYNGRQLMSHKVDFRIHHNDGSFELLETKGVETPDYKWRRKLLEFMWLPDHPDHTYTVVK